MFLPIVLLCSCFINHIHHIIFEGVIFFAKLSSNQWDWVMKTIKKYTIKKVRWIPRNNSQGGFFATYVYPIIYNSKMRTNRVNSLGQAIEFHLSKWQVKSLGLSTLSLSLIVREPRLLQWTILSPIVFKNNSASQS